MEEEESTCQIPMMKAKFILEGPLTNDFIRYLKFGVNQSMNGSNLN